MVKVVFEGQPFEIPEDTTLLDGLLECGVEVPHGCKTGTCQSCLLKCTAGEIPAEAQQGLRESQRLNHLFLSCQCPPREGMQATHPHTAADRITATIEHLRRLTPDIMEVILQPSRECVYRAGQFIRLFNPEGISRAYSLASVSGLDAALAFHIREYPEGILSQWIHHHLSVGDQVTISDPMGECFYLPGHPSQALLMIGTGSGLAPLYGILRDALEQGHTGPIHLLHGARTAEGLYLQNELNQLMALHPQLDYQPCISDPQAPLPLQAVRGRASDIALATHPDLRGWRIFLCGNPDMVRAMNIQSYLAGAALGEIHADPFDCQAPV